MRRVFQTALSFILGFVLMIPLSSLFEVMHWPTFHGWGLAHGGALAAWPTLGLVSFALLSFLLWFRDMLDAPLIVVAALIGLGVVAVSAPCTSEFRALAYLLAVAFGCSAVLCYFARRQWFVALVIALPMIFFDASFFLPLLLIDLLNALGYTPLRGFALWLGGYRILSGTLPILISAFLGMGVAYFIRRVVGPRTERPPDIQ